MNETNRVVARFLDGSTVKGTTDDFFPNRPTFHLYAVGDTTSQSVACARLKAIFFVKDLVGDRAREDARGFAGEAQDPNTGKKIAVLFKDGELLCGHTLSYTSDRSGFFVMPDDPNTNNIRIYVLKHATQKIGVGPQADALVQQVKSKAA